VEQQKLLNLVQFSPTSIDSLVNETSDSVENISSTLLILELQGHIESVAGGGFIRVK